MVELIGEQYRCPECYGELGTPDTPVDQMKVIKARHEGSKKCAETRKIIQYALGAQQDQRPAPALERMQGQNVIVQVPEQGEEPFLEEAVTFGSPSRFLRIRLKRSRTIWAQDGRQLDYIPAIYAEFADGEFRTRDPWIVNAMRSAQNNIVQLERRGFSGTNLQMKKDRFYEVGSVMSATG